jgi:hypothetical protein
MRQYDSAPGHHGNQIAVAEFTDDLGIRHAQVTRSIFMPKPPLSKARPSPATAGARALIGEFTHIRGQLGATGDAAREKLKLLYSLRDVPMTRADVLSSYHDLLMFLRAYPDDAAILAEAEHQLGAFAARIEAHKAAHHGAVASAFMDSGIVGTPVSNVFTYLFVGTIARFYPGRLEIDWNAYRKSETANVLAVLSPVVSWHESDAIDSAGARRTQACLTRCSGCFQRLVFRGSCRKSCTRAPRSHYSGRCRTSRPRGRAAGCRSIGSSSSAARP